MKVLITKRHRPITLAEAVTQCTLSNDELLAKLIGLMVEKDMISRSQLEELFYWDFDIEEIK